jgi:hypothetical protein
MTAAYLTEPEIIRELRLPEKVGRAKMAEWKLSQTFPKPVSGLSGRRFWPAVERWLLAHEGVVDISQIALPVADGKENFDAWKERRKAKAGKAAGPRNPRHDLPPPPQPGRMAPNVVAHIGPGGARLPQDHLPPVAPVGGDSPAA